MKTDTVALTKRPQGVDSGLEAVGSLGHKHEVLALHLGHNSAPGLSANPVQKPARSSPRHVYRGFISSLPWGKDLLFHLDRRSCANWCVTQRPGHLPE